jgi:YD repeat-containing protein
MRILIAEDDAALANFVRQGLQAEHYTVDVAADGEQARAIGTENDYDLVVLDLNLPRMDGVNVLRHLRLKRPSLPVLVLTLRSKVEDRVQCLDTGGWPILSRTLRKGGIGNAHEICDSGRPPKSPPLQKTQGWATRGDLVKRIDNAGNTTCYTYDGLHRRLSSTYSGPNATTNRYFVYDTATVNNQTMTNAKGRIAEAYTATCSTCTKLTDEGMGYDALGRLAQFYESTPNSGGYYYVPISYWANGQVETFGPFLDVAEVTITPDGEGRPLSITGAATNIVYNAASQPTQVPVSCEGTTCYPITYQYDSNTQRTTQYGFAGSNDTMTGTLTWNPNGSLGQLAIVDPSNSEDSQTCTYSADDLARLASVSCNSGTLWGQEFTYDPFGNLTKTVPSGATGVSWMPGYSPSTNQYTLGGTSYDLDGNVLKDTFNSYTWDAEGKNLSTSYGGEDNYAFTYDAFGHMAELAVNGVYYRSYLALGRYRFEATGQNAEYSEVPLPGGSIFSTGRVAHPFAHFAKGWDRERA